MLLLGLILLLTSCINKESDNKSKTNIITEDTTLAESTNKKTEPTTNKKTKNEQTTKSKTQPTTVPVSTEKKIESKKIIDFSPISQYPELPTGCEVTSLAMVLNHYGVQCNKCEIADTYLSKGPVGTVDFNKAFEGDPRDADSYGCYANVIVEAAKRIIYSKHANLSVKDCTGTELKTLFRYVKKDIPVIVWGTQNCQKGHYSVTWHVDGEDLTWFTPEHCMVLVGYDNTYVWVADPMHGDIRSYSISTFEKCYNSLYKQSIVIR